MAENNWPRTFSAFVLGVGLGALAGVLLAPAAGEKTRRKIRDAVQDGYGNAIDHGQEILDRASDTLDDLRERVADAADAGTKVLQQVKSAVS